MKFFGISFCFITKKNWLNSFLTSLWNYDIERHKMHHNLCLKNLEDKVIPIEIYKVQKISNVFLVGLLAFVVELIILYEFGFLNIMTLFFNAVFSTVLYASWYWFEDHFHIAMHKRSYYEQYIQHT